MAIVRRESRCRIGIVWFDSEAQADRHARMLTAHYGQQAIDEANIGYAQCGRAPEHDRPGEYAVITP